MVYSGQFDRKYVVVSKFIEQRQVPSIAWSITYIIYFYGILGDFVQLLSWKMNLSQFVSRMLKCLLFLQFHKKIELSDYWPAGSSTFFVYWPVRLSTCWTIDPKVYSDHILNNSYPKCDKTSPTKFIHFWTLLIYAELICDCVISRCWSDRYQGGGGNLPPL